MRAVEQPDGWKAFCSALGALALSLTLLTAPTSAAEPTPSPAPQLVRDVALGPDGILRGRVFAPSTRPLWVRIEPAGGPRNAGATVAVDQGRFAVAGLRRGMYHVSLGGGPASVAQVYRVWEAGIAPPAAAAEMILVAGPPAVVRGQRPVTMPAVSLKQAALYSGIVAGAVATPIIYHNARTQNRVPASP